MTEKMPVLFVGHGSPMNAIEDNEVAKQLKELREEGVLIISSGNIVHNLSLVEFRDFAYDWATEFDAKVKNWILSDDHDPLINFNKQGESALLSINSGEHYLPLLYSLALKDENEPVSFFAEKVWGGSISMRSVRIG